MKFLLIKIEKSYNILCNKYLADFLARKAVSLSQKNPLVENGSNILVFQIIQSIYIYNEKNVVLII